MSETLPPHSSTHPRLERFITGIMYAGPILGAVIGFIIGYRDLGWYATGVGVNTMALLCGFAGLIVALLVDVICRCLLLVMKRIRRSG